MPSLEFPRVVQILEGDLRNGLTTIYGEITDYDDQYALIGGIVWACERFPEDQQILLTETEFRENYATI